MAFNKIKINGVTYEIDVDMASINESLTEINTKLDGLTTQVDELTTQADEVATQVDELTTRVDVLDSKINKPLRVETVDYVETLIANDDTDIQGFTTTCPLPDDAHTLVGFKYGIETQTNDPTDLTSKGTIQTWLGGVDYATQGFVYSGFLFLSSFSITNGVLKARFGSTHYRTTYNKFTRPNSIYMRWYVLCGGDYSFGKYINHYSHITDPKQVEEYSSLYDSFNIDDNEKPIRESYGYNFLQGPVVPGSIKSVGFDKISFQYPTFINQDGLTTDIFATTGSYAPPFKWRYTYLPENVKITNYETIINHDSNSDTNRRDRFYDLYADSTLKNKKILGVAGWDIPEDADCSILTDCYVNEDGSEYTYGTPTLVIRSSSLNAKQTSTNVNVKYKILYLED